MSCSGWHLIIMRYMPNEPAACVLCYGIALRLCRVRRRIGVLPIGFEPLCFLIRCRTAASVIAEGLLCMGTRCIAPQQHFTCCCHSRSLWRLP